MIDTCIVFPNWHVRSTFSFILSCLVIVALGIFYEYLREFQKKYDHQLALSLVAKSKGKVRAGSGRSTPEFPEQEQTSLLGRNMLGVRGAG